MRPALLTLALLLAALALLWSFGFAAHRPVEEPAGDPDAPETASALERGRDAARSRPGAGTALPHLQGSGTRPTRERVVIHVVDAQGAPVPRADLHAWFYSVAPYELSPGAEPFDYVGHREPRLEFGERRSSRRRAAVQDGRATLDRVPAGCALVLRVRHPQSASGRPLNLRSGDVLADGWETGPVTVVLPAGRRLRGRVVDTSGAAVSSAEVRVMPEDAMVRPYYEAYAETRTDAGGRFKTAGLPSIPLAVRVERGSRWLASDVVPVALEESDVRIVVPSTCSTTIHVVDADGHPVSDVMVQVESKRWGRREGRTDEHGDFAPGPVPGDGSVTVRTLWRAGGPLFPPSVRRNVRFEDDRYILRLADPLTLEGQACDAAGDPVPWGTVEIEGTTPDLRHLQLRAPIQHGRFVIRRLLPGAYRLRARGPPAFARLPPRDIRVPASDLRLVFDRGVSAAGRVLGSRPWDVTVEWFSPDGDLRKGVVDDDGGFAIEGLSDEPGTLLARRTATTQGMLLEGVCPSAGPFPIRLGPGGTISGRVGARRVPVARGARLTLRRDPLALPVRIAYDGTFETPAVPIGRYDLVLTRDQDVLGRLDGVHPGQTDTVVALLDTTVKDGR